jgi:hypothetical protein
MIRRTLLRSATTLAIALSALIPATGPAAAISEESETGTVGNWIANDSEQAPGGKCKYDEEFLLRRLSARPPIVYAAHAGGQRVGWRLKVVHSHLLPNNDQYGEDTVYESKFQKDRATLGRPADFTRKAWVPDIEFEDSSRFKVWVIIKWYRDGQVEGTVEFRYDWFRQVGPSSSDAGEDFYCYKAPF